MLFTHVGLSTRLGLGWSRMASAGPTGLCSMSLILQQASPGFGHVTEARFFFFLFFSDS